MPASPIELFVFPRMFGSPKLSAFCCKFDAFAVAYTHLSCDEGLRYTRARFDRTFMSGGPILTPIETLIREFLRAQPRVLADARRMLEGFFPERATSSSSERHPLQAPVRA
jgi:hypothetical protein